MTKPALAPSPIHPPETAGLAADARPALGPGARHEPVSGPTSAKRAVLYLRVSTARQAGTNSEVEGYSIPQQREHCVRRRAKSAQR